MPLNDQLVVLVLLKCVWFLSILAFYDLMHKPTFKMPTIRQVGTVLSKVIMLFSVDLKDDYVHIPIVKNHC